MSTRKQGTGKDKNVVPVQNEPDATIGFEVAMSKLEGVIGELERDDLELENALASFEAGVHLMRICDTHLRHARGKISQLLQGEDGAFAEKIIGTSLESFLRQETEHD